MYGIMYLVYMNSCMHIDHPRPARIRLESLRDGSTLVEHSLQSTSRLDWRKNCTPDTKILDRRRHK